MKNKDKSNNKNEFRWNKKRKHYSYIFKRIGANRLNILITSKPYVTKKGKIHQNNVPLFRHPNPSKTGRFYLIPRKYFDNYLSFDKKIYIGWRFDRNDKRKVKRIKRINTNKKVGYDALFQLITDTIIKSN